IWPNGDAYNGMWEENERTGYGTYFFTNGDVYSGMWEGNEQTGYGTYAFASGNAYIGMFNESRRDGLGIVLNTEGTVEEIGEWEPSEYDEDKNSKNSILVEDMDKEHRDTENLIQYGIF